MSWDRFAWQLVTMRVEAFAVEAAEVSMGSPLESVAPHGPDNKPENPKAALNTYLTQLATSLEA